MITILEKNSKQLNIFMLKNWDFIILKVIKMVDTEISVAVLFKDV